jgi:hypothetical protein
MSSRRRRLLQFRQQKIASIGGGGTPTILLSGGTVLESATSGTVVGILSVANGTGPYTFTITADPDNKFDIVNDDELQTNATLNYEVATSHSVTIEAADGSPIPNPRTFVIPVINVLEVTLSALTLNNDDIEEGSAPGTVVGALQSVTSGSTLSLTDDAGGRFALSGGNVVAGLVATNYATATSHNITVRETHPDGSNSPRDTVIEITVEEFVDPGDYVPSLDFSDDRNSQYLGQVV